MSTTNQNYLIDALNTVLAWNLPDESLPLTLVSQTLLMSGFDTSQDWQDFTEFYP